MKKKCGLLRKIPSLFNTIFIILLTAVIIIPFLKVFCSAISNTDTNGLNLLPPKIDLTAFKGLNFFGFWTQLSVSAYTTLMTTLIGLLFSAVGAYILIQKDMPGVRLFKYILVLTLFFDLGLIPKYIAIRQIGLYNSLWAVILYLSFNIGNLFILYACFRQLPQNIFEAAEIDGSSPVCTFFKILLPMSKPYLAAVGFMLAASAWNEYICYLVYIRDTSKYNLQCYIRDIYSSTICYPPDDWVYPDFRAWCCAGVLAAAIPVFILLPFFINAFNATAEKVNLSINEIKT